MPAHEVATIAAPDLRDLCAKIVDDLDITGAQVAIATSAPDSVVHAEAGTANADLGTPVTANTCFQIGSATKVLTAMLVMQLVDQGLIDLDRAVMTYMPGVPLAAGEDWRSITPRHLMSMTAGLDNGPYADSGRGDDCVARYVDLLAEIPQIFSPGSAYGYSNASARVSGRLIELMTGQCWDEALRDRLLAPAGLGEFVSLFEALPYHPIAVGRLPGSEASVRPWCYSRGCGPSGATLAASARDLVRLGQIFLRRGLAADGARILSESAVDSMHTEHVEVPARMVGDAWCLGPRLQLWGDLEVFGHSGSTPNGSSSVRWIPEHDLVIASLVNAPSWSHTFHDVVHDTVLCNWLGLVRPPSPEPNPDETVDPSRYVGRYEAWGLQYEVTHDSGELMLGVRGMRSIPALGDDEVLTVLRPIGPHRFLPGDRSATFANRWDIAFTIGAGGRADLLHNGGFTARRTA